MRRQSSLFLLLVLFGLVLPLSVASADVGPKPTLTVRILYDGQPISDPQVQARLLLCAEPGNDPYGRSQPLPGFDRLDLQDPSGCVWQEPGYYISAGTCRNGACTFSGALPKRFRVAVYLPVQGRLYLTGAAERQAMHERFAAELTADGTGHLRSDPLPVIGRNWSLPGMVMALLLTLAVELTIVAAYTRLTKAPLRRLLIVGLVVNALSLPCVWLLAGLGYLLAGVEAGLVALAVAEGLAWLFEALVYTIAGRLAFGRALLLSLAANAASLLIGLVVH